MPNIFYHENILSGLPQTSKGDTTCNINVTFTRDAEKKILAKRRLFADSSESYTSLGNAVMVQ